MLTYEQIKDLIKSVDCSSLRIFELEDEDFKLKLSKNEESLKSNIEDNNLVKELETQVASSKVNRNLLNTIEEVRINDNSINSNEASYYVVKSPLVGTYYSSGTPGGKPYVKKGDLIKKGDVLCIVEAMKIMNEITSEFDGEIVEVLRTDEDIVEYGMELFKIK